MRCLQLNNAKVAISAVCITNNLERHFFKGDSHIKGNIASLVIREIQFKSTIKYQLALTTMTKILKSVDEKVKKLESHITNDDSIKEHINFGNSGSVLNNLT